MLRLSSVSIIIASIYVRTLNIDEPLARIEADGTVRYYHADALGSVTALTDSSGAVKRAEASHEQEQLRLENIS